MNLKQKIIALSLAVSATMMVACNSEDNKFDNEVTPKNKIAADAIPNIPQLKSPQSVLVSQEEVQSRLLNIQNLLRTKFNGAVITSAQLDNTSNIENITVIGYMNANDDGSENKDYKINFKIRLPLDWKGRIFYQGNGAMCGEDVNKNQTTGHSGVYPLENALQKGFAVVTDDCGHTTSQNNSFGLDQQARLNYGYKSLIKVTNMTKQVVKAIYKTNDFRTYAGGTSNGGRAVMQGAIRYGDQFDGIVANTPGMHLPKAAIANAYGNSLLKNVSNDLTYTTWKPKLLTVANAILKKCDSLDGLVDGLVNNSEQCQQDFNIQADVQTCDIQIRDNCLTNDEKIVLNTILGGVKDSQGNLVYASHSWDPGIATQGWWDWIANYYDWIIKSSITTSFIVPPIEVDTQQYKDFKVDANNINSILTRIHTTTNTYNKTSWAYMTPNDPLENVNELNLNLLRNHGGKLLITQGSADPIFTANDTANWYDQVAETYKNTSPLGAYDFVRFFKVPGMNHSGGGPTTDQYDQLDTLVNWVEKGITPNQIKAKTRSFNHDKNLFEIFPKEIIERPLCPYPQFAKYNGYGNTSLSSNFNCIGQLKY